jgi:hypothetical protein
VLDRGVDIGIAEPLRVLLDYSRISFVDVRRIEDEFEQSAMMCQL